MSKKEQTNHLNHEINNISKTGYSNSRLDVNEFYISDPKLSFDAMTI